jgi:hypothetical protein
MLRKKKKTLRRWPYVHCLLRLLPKKPSAKKRGKGQFLEGLFLIDEKCLDGLKSRKGLESMGAHACLFSCAGFAR